MPLHNKKILIIDDANAIRTFLRISLEAQGSKVYEAGTAELGLKLREDTRPDLVVLDLGLPDKDGLDIIEPLKQQDSDGRQPIIIVLTVRKEALIKEKAFNLGVNGYLTKPFIMDNLLELIDEKIKTPSLEKFL